MLETVGFCLFSRSTLILWKIIDPRHCVDWSPSRNPLEHVKSEFSSYKSLKICVKLWILQNLFYLWLIWEVILFCPLFGILWVILADQHIQHWNTCEFLWEYVEFIDSIELYASYVIMWTMWTFKSYYMFKSLTLCEILVNHCSSELMNIELYTNIESKGTMYPWNDWFYGNVMLTISLHIIETCWLLKLCRPSNLLMWTLLDFEPLNHFGPRHKAKCDHWLCGFWHWLKCVIDYLGLLTRLSVRKYFGHALWLMDIGPPPWDYNKDIGPSPSS